MSNNYIYKIILWKKQKKRKYKMNKQVATNSQIYQIRCTQEEKIFFQKESAIAKMPPAKLLKTALVCLGNQKESDESKVNKVFKEVDFLTSQLNDLIRSHMTVVFELKGRCSLELNALDLQRKIIENNKYLYKAKLIDKFRKKRNQIKEKFKETIVQKEVYYNKELDIRDKEIIFLKDKSRVKRIKCIRLDSV